jgi:hypothetical protein
MRIKSPATYVLFLIFVCFAAGVLSILLKPDQLLDTIGSPSIASPIPTEGSFEQSPSAVVNDGAMTILILGVDHIADPEGKLLAVWLLSFQPRGENIGLYGLALDTPISSSGLSIEESFNLWDPPEFGAGFIRQLGDFAPSPIRGFVALDEHGFAVLLDYFGGIDLDDQHLVGSSVIGSLRLTYDSPQAALKLQARVLESLRSRVDRLGSTPELTTLTALAPIHAYTSPSPPELATLAIPLLPLEPDQISITIHPPAAGP